MYFFEEIIDFTWGNVSVELSVASHAKTNVASHLNSDVFFPAGERVREREREKREERALWGNESKGFEE